MRLLACRACHCYTGLSPGRPDPLCMVFACSPRVHVEYFSFLPQSKDM
uniref:Uncharacterized protein n=1 Tax=Anguilla anguilla TaxID=7936 RepID=A0A0E9QDF4_ANGAN